MKSIILILCLISFAPFVANAEKYKHKSEAELMQMTPAQRVDEYANEQAYHKYDVLDEHSELIEKYIWRDGLKALPRIVEIIDEYDLTRTSGRQKRKGERFDGVWMLLTDLDNHIIRLRASEEGKRAMDALERAIARMQQAGYGQPYQSGWEKHGRIEFTKSVLKNIKGIGTTDEAIQQTFEFEYKINLSEAKLIELSNFLAANYSDYPGWSKIVNFRDYSRFNYAGNPSGGHTLRNPKRFYEAYLEFEKTKY